MNIKQAKEQIKKTMQLYFLKDELGAYRLPVEQQRPVFLMGPPGIGKTAIMQQIAAELNVGLVSYSMTHHTRQSALGLPFIVEKEFQNRTYSIAEYTMSEIIAAVYREIEKNGHTEGILFLDEINCVSETLAPAMLQFLQYKVFGMHSVPEGWLIVTAGNPPEYNTSAREFDMATWDRLKRMDVEPDLEVWKEYARTRQVHGAVRSYLELHPEHFYSIERTLEGQHFVTARGWEDLSALLKLYDEQGLAVEPELFGQYLQHDTIAEEFCIYFELYRKYQSDYQIDRILSGTASEELKERAKKAPLDERIMVAGMLNDAILSCTKAVMKREAGLIALRDWLKLYKGQPDMDLSEKLGDEIAARQKECQEKIERNALSSAAYEEEKETLEIFSELYHEIKGQAVDQVEQFLWIKEQYLTNVEALKSLAEDAKTRMDHMLLFAEEAFGNGVELLLILAELTEQDSSGRYLARYGCEAYFRYSKELMLQDKLDQIAATL